MLYVGNWYKRVAECEHCALHILKLTEEGSGTLIWMSFTFSNGQPLFIIHFTHCNATPFANHNLQCRMGSITWCGHAATFPENEFASSLISRLLICQLLQTLMLSPTCLSQGPTPIFQKLKDNSCCVHWMCVIDSMYLIIVINV